MIDCTDLPGMDDVCYGKDHCEACMRANAGGFCPCGEEGDE
jgi:hypothetical protein